MERHTGIEPVSVAWKATEQTNIPMPRYSVFAHSNQIFWNF